MSKDMLVLDALEQLSERRKSRRAFFRQTLGVTACAVAAGTLLSAGGSPAMASKSSDQQDMDVLNFALNLEYLEAQFYSHATTGNGLPSSALSGTGNQGQVKGGRMVNFSGDTITQQYANEIAGDEIDHVNFLRSALGKYAVAQPAIDIGGTDPNSAFSVAAQAAGVVPKGTAFDPYASSVNFLLGAFIFEDVGVTAYKGASPLITNKTYLESAAGILAAEAYHAGLVRTVLYSKGMETPAILTDAGKISNARDSLDGTSDDDQGLGPHAGESNPSNTRSNIVPLDKNGLAYSRTTGQVLNIVYLNSAAVSKGGFFPKGVNGTYKTSAASN